MNKENPKPVLYLKTDGGDTIGLLHERGKITSPQNLHLPDPTEVGVENWWNAIVDHVNNKGVSNVRIFRNACSPLDSRNEGVKRWRK